MDFVLLFIFLFGLIFLGFIIFFVRPKLKEVKTEEMCLNNEDLFNFK